MLMNYSTKPQPQRDPQLEVGLRPTPVYSTSLSSIYKPPKTTTTSVQVQKPSTSSGGSTGTRFNSSPTSNRGSTGTGFKSSPTSSGGSTGVPINIPFTQTPMWTSNGYQNATSPTGYNTNSTDYSTQIYGGKTDDGYKMPSLGELYNESKLAVDEAKKKQEESKTSALGYYDQFGKMLPQYQQQLGQNYNQSMSYYEPLANQLAGMQGDIISPEQMQRLKNERTDALASSSQNLMGAFGDSDSGIQTGRRLGIAMGTANEASNIPLQAELDVGQANRAVDRPRIV